MSPDYPDPMTTAQAQAGLNQDTATTQQLLNMTNQVTPTGTLSYQQTGNTGFVDSNGKWVSIPRYTATTELTPEQQSIFNTNQETQANIAGIGRDQSARIGSLLSTPLDLSNTSVEDRLWDLASSRMDPQWAQSEEGLRARLANSGIKAGSDAYNREFANFSQAKNDAYNQLLLNGRGQAVQEMLTERNQPINEISALLSGSQVSMPSFTSTPQTSVGGVDYSGLVDSKYKADAASQAAMLGGLFGLAGAGVSAFSDRRLKRDIRCVGALDNGLPVYAYRMAGSDVVQLGLMADEVEAVKPWAVSEHHSGFKMVNYDAAVGD